MTYQLPSVNIYQILTRASQSLADSQLLPCLVGPLYQVVKNSSITLTFPVSGSTTISYPGLKVGAILDTSTIKINVVNATVAIIAAGSSISNLTFTAGSPNVVSTTVVFTNVKSGDNFILSGVAGSYIIKSVSSDFKTLVFTTNVNYVPSSETYGISRSVGDVLTIVGSPSYSSTSLTFTSLTYNGNTITSGNANISFVALRRDLTGFYEVVDETTLALDMDIDPLNPLGFNAGLTVPSASGGRNLLLYILSDYTLEKYLAAYEELNTRTDSYFIVPVLNTGSDTQTFNESIMTSASSNAIAESDPLISNFRSALVITPLVQEEILTDSSFEMGT